MHRAADGQIKSDGNDLLHGRVQRCSDASALLQSLDVGIWPLSAQFMQRSMRESDAVQAVKAAGETIGDHGHSGQKSMLTTCAEGALCAPIIITKGDSIDAI